MTSGTRPATSVSSSSSVGIHSPCVRAPQVAELRRRAVADAAASPGQPIEVVVVEDDGNAVGREVQVAFDGVMPSTTAASKAASVFSGRPRCRSW